jgi:hypothetical protein
MKRFEPSVIATRGLLAKTVDNPGCNETKDGGGDDQDPTTTSALRGQVACAAKE